MLTLLILIFCITLIYAVESNLSSTLNKLLATQGVLLLGIAILEFQHIGMWGFASVASLIILFKVILLPLFLAKAVKGSKDAMVLKMKFPSTLSTTAVSAVLVGSLMVSYSFHDNLAEIKYIAVAITAMFTGAWIFSSCSKAVSHLIGFLFIENGLFLLSFTMGSEMPWLLQAGIAIDLLVAITVLYSLYNRKWGLFARVDSSKVKNVKH